jgi:hypothetical protein
VKTIIVTLCHEFLAITASDVILRRRTFESISLYYTLTAFCRRTSFVVGTGCTQIGSFSAAFLWFGNCSWYQSHSRSSTTFKKLTRAGICWNWQICYFSMNEFWNVDSILPKHIVFLEILLLLGTSLFLWVVFKIIFYDWCKWWISLCCGYLFATCYAFGLLRLNQTGQTTTTESMVAWMNCYRYKHNLKAHSAGYLLFYTFLEIIRVSFLFLYFLLFLEQIVIRDFIAGYSWIPL